MSTLKPIIEGKLVREAEALADLEKLADAGSPPPRTLRTPRKLRTPPTIQPPAVANLHNGFYQIDKSRIVAATSAPYRKFLRESGYGDLDSCSRIEIAKGILKYDQSVRQAAARAGLNLTGADGQYVVNINHPNARNLVEALGGKLLTTALMYRVFIPYIKELVQQGNPEAQVTLNEMTDTSVGKAEWLEDLILDKTRLKIGTKEKRLSLPDKDGRFDRQDINECGYPNNVKAQGEFYHWHANRDERAAICSGGPVLGLDLDWGPSVGGDWLGVRLAKIF
ncbi:MAG TPA: hypothetical protein VJA18_01935 [Candidatus Nanoarchaeia archaeon]|nr:hypothetical protein [Candidatus Nanoarchaeia archaeon]